MKAEYYKYDYWYDRYHNKEDITTLSKEGLGPISFEQYVVLYFTEEFPDGGNFFSPTFDAYLAAESAKCDPELIEVLSKGIDQTLHQVKQLYKLDPTGKMFIN